MANILMNPPTEVTGRGTRPEMPTAPTKEALEMKFEFDPSLLSGDDQTTIHTNNGTEIKTEPSVSEPVKVEEPKKAPDAPVEPKPKVEEVVVKTKVEDTKPKSPLQPSDATLPKEPKKPLSPVKDPTKPEVDPIDYSKYNEEEVGYLKQMSNGAKAFVAKKLEEAKGLSAQKDNLYLQHEDAYVLSPQYREIQTKRSSAQVEGRAWQEALIAIRDGKPFKEPVGIDANGKFVYSAERPATTQDDIRIANNLQKCINAVETNGAELAQFPSRYKETLNRDLQAIKQVQNGLFAWHQDPKILDYQMDTDNGKQSVRDIKNEFISRWPAYMRSHPAVDIAADMVVGMKIQESQLMEARNGRQVAEIKTQEVRRAEPSSSSAATEVKKDTQGRAIPSEFRLGEGMPDFR